jgi:type IV pilus assembly protein PilC
MPAVKVKGNSKASKPKAASNKIKRIPGARKIANSILPGFSRQMAAMISAGMPIVGTLHALEEQADNPHFKKVIGEIRADIENGSSLSDSLRRFPSVFDDLYCNMIRGGEAGGQLSETIARLSSFLESTARLKRKVKSAMMYPTVVLCMALIIATGLIIFVVPVFGEMFADFGADLPKPTQALLDLSNFITSNFIYIIIVIAVVSFVFKKWKASEAGSIQFDTFTLRMPVFGELKKKVASARFARTFAQLIKSGVPILTALDIVSGATGSLVAGRIIAKARAIVEKGDPLSNAFANQTIFPLVLVRMLQAGEKTGRIDEMMDNIADYFDDEVETMLSGLTSLLEPLLMVFLGVIIGGIVMCMFLPIFKMGEVVGG